MTSPSVSVVIPYSPEYTDVWMLERAIKSVESQKISTETLVVEDGDSVAEARNIGIERASSAFIAFLDADDHWRDSKLSLQYESILESECSLSLTASIRGDGSVTDVSADSEEEFVQKLLVGDLATITSSILVDMSQTDARFDESLYRFEDYDFAIQAVHDGGYCYINEPMTYSEKYESGLSADEDQERKRASKEKVFQRAIDLYPSIEDKSDKFYADLWYSAGRQAYFDSEFEQSLSYFRKSLGYQLRLKTLMAAFQTSLSWIFHLRRN